MDKHLAPIVARNQRERGRGEGEGCTNQPFMFRHRQSHTEICALKVVYSVTDVSTECEHELKIGRDKLHFNFLVLLRHPNPSPMMKNLRVFFFLIAGVQDRFNFPLHRVQPPPPPPDPSPKKKKRKRKEKTEGKKKKKR